jgi:homoserine dehydrogenase
MTKMKSIAVGVVGPGLVGKALLEQIEAHGRKYGHNALVRVAGVINSSKMLLLKEVCSNIRSELGAMSQGIFMSNTQLNRTIG